MNPTHVLAARTATLVLSALALLSTPVHAQEREPSQETEIVLEALFLRDAFPPGGREVNLKLGIEKSEPDAGTGETRLVSYPSAELAMALGERAGFTAEVGFATNGDASVEAIGASLRFLLLPPVRHATGLAASIEFSGAPQRLSESEVGIGLGAVRPLGPLALRASIGTATETSAWSPHLHGSISGAVALGPRWRVLAEVVSEVEGGEATFAAGPTVKVAIGSRTALMAGALYRISEREATPTVLFQLTQSM